MCQTSKKATELIIPTNERTISEHKVRNVRVIGLSVAKLARHI